MDLEEIAEAIRRRFDERMEARERALPASRRAIRACANAIRAIHRGEWEQAHRLMDEARAAIDECAEAVRDHPEIRYAGYLQDAEKEYAEARITEAVVTGRPIPSPEELGVEDAPYLNGVAEAIGEARRHILDLLRHGRVAEGEAALSAMDDLYTMLVTMDYPDAITGNLRRSTDVARSLIERTRGDLSVARVSQDLHDALERHAREVLGGEEQPAE
ncbi:MAG: haloacid dehalogenase [Actinomycetota bacterium]|nr:MAG: haloacid dehalogenase [Actinomycetota bacterium]